ncbi:MAG: methyltransferase domain-containing protein [Solirubrobacteraceae bacterium]|jgi:SAM-dependent methyltransferase
MRGPSIDEQRLAFGRVAELYDSARPSYPDTVIDELIGFAGLQPGARVVEVGAGTGKATRMLAERRLAVLALEPDAAMAEVARRTCSGYPLVTVEQIAFEAWQPRELVRTVISAQAWHWITPAVRYVRAGEALSPGGTLASIWTFPRWATTPLREALRDAYRETVPGLAADFPMHPASEPTDLAGDWHAEINSCEGFSGPQVRQHRWSLSYSTSAYLELLQTHQDHILLEPAQQQLLLSAISRVIDEAGGRITVDFVTRLCLARRV